MAQRINFSAGAAARRTLGLLGLLFLATDGTLWAQQLDSVGINAAIHINQVAYAPLAPKVAFLVGELTTPQVDSFDLVDDGGVVRYRGRIGTKRDWTREAGVVGETLDFSDFRQNGHYRLRVGTLQSFPITIEPEPYAEVLRAAVRSYTFQRASRAVSVAEGGVYARPAGHPDFKIQHHAGSDRAGQPPVASPGGWYDAGDYNKYVVNGAFSTAIMLLLLEQYPAALPDGSLQFGASASSGVRVDQASQNRRNDLLDELKWETDWLLTMQDTADGGVHHKLTTLKFEGMVMPHQATAQRFLTVKSTAATLDFAGCLAMAARVFERVGEGAYAKTCRLAAIRAYRWAQAHPKSHFHNPPDIATGEYGDENVDDEFAWAQLEMMRLGLPIREVRAVDATVWPRFRSGESWTTQMNNLAAYSLLAEHSDSLAKRPTLAKLAEKLRGRVISLADSLITVADTTAFLQPINDWRWGSSSDLLGAAMVTAQAYRLTGNTGYLEATQRWTDWVFGANATGYSFVTGFGAKTPQRIHHRPSEADGVAEPIPGFIVGGPNGGQQDRKDGATYPVAPGVQAQRSYTDQLASYASNEVCINWNAPLVYVLGFLTQERQAE